MTLPEEFDVIVCGGGSTGCVVAGRLGNLDHELKILLIEAGRVSKSFVEHGLMTKGRTT